MVNGIKYPRDFEVIDGGMERLKVPGGWLVHNSTTVIVKNEHYTASECLVFFPDPDYLWQLEGK